jgi:hypothetical protein
MAVQLLRILHFSDVHMTASPDADQRAVLKAFLDHVGGTLGDAPPALIAVTGDLTHSGSRTEFSTFQSALLEPLLNALHLSIDSVVVAPGNHDIVRPDKEDDLEKGLKSGLIDQTSVSRLFDNVARREAAFSRTKNFRSFVSQFQTFETQLDYGARVRLFEVDGFRVALAALDSSWRSTGVGDAEKMSLLVGESQVRQAGQWFHDQGAQPNLRVALMHHPAEWLIDFDRADVTREVSKGYDIVLSGHLHDSAPASITTPNSSCVFLQAGCLYGSRDYLNAYQVIEVQGDGSASVRMYSYFRNRDAFDVASNISSAGMFSFSIGSGTSIVPASRWMSDPCLHVEFLPTGHTRNADLRELLFQPVLLTSPPEEFESLANSEAPTIDGYRVNLTTIDPSEHWIVNGDSGSGLTCAALFIAETLRRDHGLSVDYLDVSVTRNGVTTISEALAEVGRSLEATGALAIIVDGLVGLSNSRRRKFLASVADLPTAVSVIFTCSIDAGISIEAELAREQGPTARSVFVGQLGAKEISSLSQIALPTASGEQRISVANQALTLLMTECLPRTPRVILALLAVIHEAENLDSIRSITQIVDRYIDLLLRQVPDQSERKSGLDLLARKNLLAWVAGDFFRNDRGAQLRRDLERVVADRLAALSLSISAGETVTELIGTGVLRQDGDMVRFSNHPIFHLLVAVGMQIDPSQAALVLANPLRNAPIVEHFSGLRRDSASTLQTAVAVLSSIDTDFRNQEDFTTFENIKTMSSDVSKGADVSRFLETVSESPAPEDPTREEQLSMWDNIASSPSSGLPATPFALPSNVPELLLGRLRLASDLASRVLRNSDQLADPELKLAATRTVIGAWGLYVCARMDDSQSKTSPLMVAFESDLRDAGFEKEMVSEMVIWLSFFGATFPAVLALGSKRVASLIDAYLNVAREGEDLASLVVATQISCWMRLPRWVAAVSEIYSDPRVGKSRTGVYFLSMAVSQYLYTAELSESEVSDLEKFISKVLLDSNFGREPTRERQSASSQQGALMSKLRRKRATARRSRIAALPSGL